MERFSVRETPLPGVVLIEPKVFEDERGFFLETYRLQDFHSLGVPGPFVQDNHSRSRKGVLRGLHFQKNRPQGKLVRVVRGRIFDVAVDIAPHSPTFGQWYGVELSEENHYLLYIPPSYAHGFLVLSPVADVLYKVTDYYAPEDEGGILWNDPDLGIAWPLEEVEEVLLSPKDRKWGRLRDLHFERHA